MRALVLALAMLTPGCASVRELLLPTPVACAPKDSPAKPKVTPNALLAQMDDYHLILVIGAERNDLIVYAEQADKIIQACR